VANKDLNVTMRDRTSKIATTSPRRVVWLPALIEERLERTAKAEQREPALAGRSESSSWRRFRNRTSDQKFFTGMFEGTCTPGAQRSRGEMMMEL